MSPIVKISLRASAASRNPLPPKASGYTLIILLFALTVLTLGLMVAVPVWETQIQREKEEELIFRGRQYVEAIRIFQMKYPGSFPKSLDELMQKNASENSTKIP